jgi:C-terminal processing protease CtpA/Prc
MHRRDTDETWQSWSLPWVPGPRFGGRKPVYVLVGPVTFSAAEELAYDLQTLRPGSTIVGETTRGGAHPCDAYRLHPHLELTVPIARAVNPVTGTNWEGVGVTPDVRVPAADAQETAHRLARSPRRSSQKAERGGGDLQPGRASMAGQY